MANSNHFDAIVIGSGIGGLAIAAILAKFNGKKVLILEQHLALLNHGMISPNFQRFFNRFKR